MKIMNEFMNSKGGTGTMHRTSKLAGIGAAALLAVALATPAFGFSAMSVAVLDLSVDPNPGVCALDRIWAQYNTSTLNASTCPTTGAGSCAAGGSPGLPCNRGWTSNVQGSTRGGYFSHQDNSSGFAGFTENSTFYAMMDQVSGAATGNYVGYYYLAGNLNSTTKTGKTVDENCVGTTSTSCFLPGTNTRSAGSEPNTRIDSDGNGGNGRALDNKNGFRAIPSPRVASAGASVSLTWTAAVAVYEPGAIALAPIDYKVYRFHDTPANNSCDAPAENAAGWTAIGTTAGGVLSFADLTPPTGGDCIFYALRLVIAGPSALASGTDAVVGQLTSMYKGASSQAVTLNPLASQVVNFRARYVGKNTFRTSWGLMTQGSVTGFHVSRSTAAEGAYTRVSPLIPATGDNTSYSYDDKVSRKLGTTFYYKLESMAGDTVVSTTNPVSSSLRVAK